MYELLKPAGCSVHFPQQQMISERKLTPVMRHTAVETVTPRKRLPAVPSEAWGTDLRSASSCPLPPGS